MLPIASLNLGSIDAINYKQRQEKNFLSKIFFRDEDLDAILEPRRYFLIGEKGTGKTAYAVLLTNSDYHNTKCTIKNITETDYRKFIFLRAKDHIMLSDYTDIWRTILLLLCADQLVNKEPQNLLLFDKFHRLKLAIDDYYKSAFSPEIVYALEFVQNHEVAAKLLGKHVQLAGSRGAETKKESKNFQTNLRYIQKTFEEAISSLKLNSDHILFVDGVDIRPHNIEYEDYIECIKGLAQAAWLLNSEYFANIRDSRGRIKVLVLLRPDIFNSLGYQNPNAKIRDNSVILDWRTTYENYRSSRIFRLIDGMFGKQQAEDYAEVGTAWDRYFPYMVPNLVVSEKMDNPFIGFLRYSLYRPRDVISYLLIMQDYAKLHHRSAEEFNDGIFRNCQAEYSDYLLGEIRDQLDFYYSNADFENLTLFFSYLGGRSYFDYNWFKRMYLRYREVVVRRPNTISEITEGPEGFLQFLYSLNVIGYRERTQAGDVFVHWCFRDRTRVKLNPKVRFGLDYNIHPGLARALQVGREGA